MNCEAFLKNPEVNPVTGRKIKKDGPTYKKLMSMCEEELFVRARKKVKVPRKKKPNIEIITDVLDDFSEFILRFTDSVHVYNSSLLETYLMDKGMIRMQSEALASIGHEWPTPTRKDHFIFSSSEMKRDGFTLIQKEGDFYYFTMDSIDSVVHRVVAHLMEVEKNVTAVSALTDRDVFERILYPIPVIDSADFYVGVERNYHFVNPSAIADYNPHFKRITLCVYDKEYLTIPFQETNDPLIVDIVPYAENETIRRIVQQLYNNVKTFPVEVDIINHYREFVREMNKYDGAFFPVEARRVDGKYYVAMQEEGEYENLRALISEKYLTDTLEYLIVYDEKNVYPEAKTTQHMHEIFKSKPIAMASYEYRLWQDVFGKDWGNYKNLQLTKDGIRNAARPNARITLRSILNSIMGKKLAIETNGQLGEFTLELARQFKYVVAFENKTGSVLHNNIHQNNVTILRTSFDETIIEPFVNMICHWDYHSHADVYIYRPAWFVRPVEILETAKRILAKRLCGTLIMYVSSKIDLFPTWTKVHAVKHTKYFFIEITIPDHLFFLTEDAYAEYIKDIPESPKPRSPPKQAQFSAHFARNPGRCSLLVF